MQQQIDQPRRLIAAEQIAEQLVLLRPDAGKARDRRKQGIEQSRAHAGSLRPFQFVMPGFTPGIHGFFIPLSKPVGRIGAGGVIRHLESRRIIVLIRLPHGEERVGQRPTLSGARLEPSGTLPMFRPIDPGTGLRGHPSRRRTKRAAPQDEGGGCSRRKKLSSYRPRVRTRFFQSIQQIDPTGKSPKSLSSLLCSQYSDFQKSQISLYSSPSRPNSGGRFADVTDVGHGMRWTRQRRARKGWQGGINSVSDQPARERTALN